MSDSKSAVKNNFKLSLLDLQAAKLLLDAGPQFYAHCGFNCQQSVEKAIKGYLIYNAIKFKPIHDLKELNELLKENDFETYKLIEASYFLNVFAVAFRYSSELHSKISVDEIQKAYITASDLYKILASKIPFEGSLK